MIITLADAKELNPPPDALDLIKLADKHNHTLYAGPWHPCGNTNREGFSLRITGDGVELFVTWIRNRSGEISLFSALRYMPDLGEWVNVSVRDVEALAAA